MMDLWTTPFLFYVLPCLHGSTSDLSHSTLPKIYENLQNLRTTPFLFSVPPCFRDSTSGLSPTQPSRSIIRFGYHPENQKVNRSIGARTMYPAIFRGSTSSGRKRPTVPEVADRR